VLDRALEQINQFEFHTQPPLCMPVLKD
jgi:hypothetical protein